MTKVDVVGILGDMAEVIKSPDFNAWRKDFVEEHVDVFEYGDENKLQYTPIHTQYERGLEEQLAKALPAGSTMDEFCNALVAEMDAGADLASLGEPVRLLLAAAEFDQFKEMMLYEKAQRAGDTVTATPAHLATSNAAAMGAFHDLNSLLAKMPCMPLRLEGGGEWKYLHKTPTTTLCTKRVAFGEPGSGSAMTFVYGCYLLELALHEALEMYTCRDAERMAKWNTNFKGGTVLRGEPKVPVSDEVIEIELDFGILVHLAGMPRRVTLRTMDFRDEPEEGGLTRITVPWKDAEDVVDAASFIAAQAIVVEPAPDKNPSLCQVTTLDVVPLPAWFANSTIAYMSPQIMTGMVQRYIKASRPQGK